MKHVLKIGMMAAAPAALMSTAAPASATSDELLGQVIMVGYQFCPRNTVEAAGQLLKISDNTALFSLYGPTFGGDARKTFGLPDMRGRVVIGQGEGVNDKGDKLYDRKMGMKGGQEWVTLTMANMPSHSHTAQLRAENTANADTGNPVGNTIGRTTTPIYSDTAVPRGASALHPSTIHVDAAGLGKQHDNMMPYIVMRYCIVTNGTYPSRN